MTTPTLDPRLEVFRSLSFQGGSGSLAGRWQFKHVGCGHHGFVNLDTGDYVPAERVNVANR